MNGHKLYCGDSGSVLKAEIERTHGIVLSSLLPALLSASILDTLEYTGLVPEGRQQFVLHAGLGDSCICFFSALSNERICEAGVCPWLS